MPNFNLLQGIRNAFSHNTQRQRDTGASAARELLNKPTKTIVEIRKRGRLDTVQISTAVMVKSDVAEIQKKYTQPLQPIPQVATAVKSKTKPVISAPSSASTQDNLAKARRKYQQLTPIAKPGPVISNPTLASKQANLAYVKKTYEQLIPLATKEKPHLNEEFDDVEVAMNKALDESYAELEASKPFYQSLNAAAADVAKANVLLDNAIVHHAVEQEAQRNLDTVISEVNSELEASLNSVRSATPASIVNDDVFLPSVDFDVDAIYAVPRRPLGVSETSSTQLDVTRQIYSAVPSNILAVKVDRFGYPVEDHTRVQRSAADQAAYDLIKQVHQDLTHGDAAEIYVNNQAARLQAYAEAYKGDDYFSNGSDTYLSTENLATQANNPLSLKDLAALKVVQGDSKNIALAQRALAAKVTVFSPSLPLPELPFVGADRAEIDGDVEHNYDSLSLYGNNGTLRRSVSVGTLYETEESIESARVSQ